MLFEISFKFFLLFEVQFIYFFFVKNDNLQNYVKIAEIFCLKRKLKFSIQ